MVKSTKQKALEVQVSAELRAEREERVHQTKEHIKAAKRDAASTRFSVKSSTTKACD